MHHPILGKIEIDPDLSNTYSGTAATDQGPIKFSLNPDDEELNMSIEATAKAIKKIQDLIRHSLVCISRDLLDSYNNAWRCYMELQPDGSYKDIDNPELTPDEFTSSFKFKNIHVYGCEMIDLWFIDTKDYFSGHGIEVCWINYEEPTSAKASIVG